MWTAIENEFVYAGKKDDLFWVVDESLKDNIKEFDFGLKTTVW